jgi:two-component system response regulator PilR (NtrC family)
MIGQSVPMRQLMSLIERVASSDVPVLITGESGTGKEDTAQLIHKLSSRSDGP